jgi:hypothetical protein
MSFASPPCTPKRTDGELLKVWQKSHQDGSVHTVRVYQLGERFLDAIAAAGSGLRKATVEDVQAALAAMRTKEDGSPVRPVDRAGALLVADDTGNAVGLLGSQ